MDFDIVTVASKGWELLDFGMNGVPMNAYTDASVRVIKAMQTAQGHWSASENRRPPMAAEEFQTAALAIYAIQHYAPAGDEATSEQAVARAIAWLERATPGTTQDRAFQALGLAWGNAGSDATTRAIRAARRDAAGRRRLEPTAAHRVGRLRHRASAVCAPHGRRDVHQGSRVPERRRLSAQDPGGRWHLAGQVALDLAAALFRERISVRPGPVHFYGRHCLGVDGACGSDSAAHDHAEFEDGTVTYIPIFLMT